MPKPMRTRPVSAAPTPARHKNSPTRYVALESVNEPPEKTMHKFWSSWVKLAAMALRSSASFDVCCR